jgi:predicted MFS family arabinose efflux permease
MTVPQPGPRPGRHGGALRNTVFQRLLAAQLISLVGTGVTTVALSLLAFDLAGGGAGEVLGFALALKVTAYITVAPIAAALTVRANPKRLLITLDLARAVVIAAMPFVSAVWQVYALIFTLSACSAVFTPAFQALIPSVLPDERQYTSALSLSRIAYELENLASPAITAVLLTAITYHALFAVDAASFLLSATLLSATKLPAAPANGAQRTIGAITRGVRRYLRTDELRSLLALNLACAAASAMIIVNTVLYVEHQLQRGQTDVAIALAAAGAGALAAALAVPTLLRRYAVRDVMLTAAALLPAGLLALTATSAWSALLMIWVTLGIGLGLVQTPAGLLVQRNATHGDATELFAAQFALSHACWLITYPLAGVLATRAGLPTTALVLATTAALAVAAALTASTSATDTELQRTTRH